MSYFVICTFDLKDATREDYQTAYAELAKLGLKKVVVGNSGVNTVMPTTTTAGSFNGASAEKVANDVRAWVASAFASRRLRSEIFVLAAGDWAWSAATT